jgi:hypothetical protein
MSVSEVQICNLALLKYGDVTITSISNPTDKQGRACKVLYPIVRDRMLYAFNWNFAMRRADISAQLSTTPDFQWDYAYTLPIDCFRAVELYGTDAEWQVENGKLLTNQEEDIYLRYIAQVTETGKFNPAFVNCVAIALAAELAAKLAGDKARNKRVDLINELETVELPRAFRLNSIEGKRAREKDEQSMDNGNFSWQTTGHSGDLISEDRVFST